MKHLPLLSLVIMAIICSCSQKKATTMSNDPEPLQDSSASAPEEMDSDSVICSHIKAYLHNDEDAVQITESAKEDLFESSWPEVFCSVEKTLDAPWEKLTVKKVGVGKYKYECICPEHGDKYVDNWTISAHLDNGTVIITHITPDEVLE